MEACAEDKTTEYFMDLMSKASSRDDEKRILDEWYDWVDGRDNDLEFLCWACRYEMYRADLWHDIDDISVSTRNIMSDNIRIQEELICTQKETIGLQEELMKVQSDIISMLESILTECFGDMDVAGFAGRLQDGADEADEKRKLDDDQES